MRTIALTQDKVAIVDDEDYEYLNQWKWHTQKIGNVFYAMRRFRTSNGLGHSYMHRLVAARSGLESSVDHVNRNGLDNRRSNLRPATNKQNQENMKVPSDNKSGHKGVSYCRTRHHWRACIGHNNKVISLGRFDTLEEAIAARQAAEKLYFTHGGVK